MLQYIPDNPQRQVMLFMLVVVLHVKVTTCLIQTLHLQFYFVFTRYLRHWAILKALRILQSFNRLA